jgi:hypothetical protein
MYVYKYCTKCTIVENCLRDDTLISIQIFLYIHWISRRFLPCSRCMRTSFIFGALRSHSDLFCTLGKKHSGICFWRFIKFSPILGKTAQFHSFRMYSAKAHSFISNTQRRFTVSFHIFGKSARIFLWIFFLKLFATLFNEHYIQKMLYG